MYDISGMKRFKAVRTQCVHLVMVGALLLLGLQQADAFEDERFNSESSLRKPPSQGLWLGSGKLRGPMPQGKPNEPMMQVVTFEVPQPVHLCSCCVDQYLRLCLHACPAPSRSTNSWQLY